MKKRKWFIYTVIIGLIPFFIRLLIFIITKNTTLNYIFNGVDLVMFGLVLNLTNINELENLDIEKKWKTTKIGLSVVMLILFSSFLALVYISDLKINLPFDEDNIRLCAIILSTASFIMSYSIYNRLNNMI